MRNVKDVDVIKVHRDESNLDNIYNAIDDGLVSKEDISI